YIFNALLKGDVSIDDVIESEMMERLLELLENIISIVFPDISGTYIQMSLLHSRELRQLIGQLTDGHSIDIRRMVIATVLGPKYLYLSQGNRISETLLVEISNQ